MLDLIAEYTNGAPLMDTPGFDIICKKGYSLGKTRYTQSTRLARGAGPKYVLVRSTAAPSIACSVLASSITAPALFYLRASCAI